MSMDCRRFALIGLDGSGKSANINLMKQDHDYGRYHFVWVRWKPLLLKPAYWFLNHHMYRRKNHQTNLPQNHPQNQPTDQQNTAPTGLDQLYDSKTGLKSKIFRNPIIRAIWLALALIDYCLQFYVKVIWLVIGNKLIIFDRFYLDFFVDQGINFGYSPARIEAEIIKYQWLFPRLDRYVYLRVSPVTCLKRKGDIPNLDYLSRRFDIYEHLAHGNKWIAVDSEESLDTVNRTLKKLIIG
jgi:thymidylate kinase